MPTPATPIADIYRAAHARFSDRVALRDSAGGRTFAELGTRAHRVGNALRKLGAAPGERMATLSPNRVAWVEADHGFALGGYARTGLLPRLHVAEVAMIVEDVEPYALFVDGEWLAENGRDWVPSQVREVIVMGDASHAPGSFVPYEELVASGGEDELPSVDPDAIAWIMYTSGSTGLPKGVLATQRGVGASIRNILAEMPSLSYQDTALHTAPISHFSGSILAAVAAVGATNVLEPGFEANRVVEAAEGGDITVLPLVPTMITMLLEELAGKDPPKGRLGSVRLVAYAGSAIQPDRAVAAGEYFGEVMTQFYGSSEAPIPISCLRPEDHTQEKGSGGQPHLASAGRISKFVEVKILSPEGSELTQGESGEIAVFGEQVAPGYWRQPEAMAEVFKDGWVRTGDIGYLDDDGLLYIVDRRKDMIITGSFNVYPREVENAISSLAEVREVAVVGAPDERWGELITAMIVLEQDSELTPEEVIAHCRRSIGGYKVPKRVEFVEELPKTGSGKVMRAKIKDQLWANRERRV